MDTKQYIAFDLGNSKIAAMGAEVSPDGMIKILGVESVPANCIKHGIVNKVSDAAMKMGTVKKYLQNSAKIVDTKSFGLAINANTMKAQELSINRKLRSGKPITFKQLEEMAQEARKQFDNKLITPLDVIPQTYLLDGIAIENPENRMGKSLTGRYTVVYGNKIIKDNIEKTSPRSLSNIAFDCISSEALSAALLTDDDRKNGCAIIDLGAGNTTLSVYTDGVLKDLLVVPLGGQSITNDIMEAGADAGTAETLKHQFPSVNIEFPKGIDNKLLGLIIESRLEEIMVPIIDVVQKYKNKLSAGIVLIGGGSTPDYIVAYINEKTGVLTRRGDYSHLLDEESKKYKSSDLALMVGIIALWHSTETENVSENDNIVEPKPKTKPRKPLSNIIKWIQINIDRYFPESLMSDFFTDDVDNKPEEQTESAKDKQD